MDRNQQEKKDKTPVVSPLANDKTYGERWYTTVFDWGLNYWTNLLSSAGFSQWAEHSTREIKIPGLMKEAASPRQIQENLANGIAHNGFLNSLMLGKLRSETAAVEGIAAGEAAVARRSMAMARSLTLLAPGFLVMIPSVWLGAKIKPWFVEKLNAFHYGAEAMDDPSLKARHQAIAAEVRPTLLGTLVARMGTVGAVQLTALTIGSDKNFINKIGQKTGNAALQNFKGVDPVAENMGIALGNAVPVKMQEQYNHFATRKSMNWSNKQLEVEPGLAGTPYTKATQDLGRYIATDTIYTLVSALTIRPLLKMLRFIPGMSYKPDVAANTASFEGTRVKVPTNRYSDAVEDAPAKPIDTKTVHEIPSPRISQAEHHTTLTPRETALQAG